VARGRADRLSTVRQEIRQAQAEALGRTGARLEAILGRLASLDRRLDALLAGLVPGDGPAERHLAELLEGRDRLRDEAIRARDQLIVQREAIGLRRQAAVEQCYPVPARRRAARPRDRRGGEP
jgi:hypothetical protein